LLTSSPSAAILGSDYWFNHKQKIDVPDLYRAHGRYRYNNLGTNWRAVVAFLVSVGPNLPGMYVILSLPNSTPRFG
jgi:nucleobase:cation symporter-1, NCS1 family